MYFELLEEVFATRGGKIGLLEIELELLEYVVNSIELCCKFKLSAVLLRSAEVVGLPWPIRFDIFTALFCSSLS